MTPYRQVLRGIALIVVSQFAFIVNDTFVKLAGDALPMGQILFVRGCICSLMIAAFAVAMGAHRRLRVLRHRMIAWRLVGELGGTFFYIIALLKMPIGSVTIIFQAVPLTVTAGAAMFLGEIVGWRRWFAILAGFVGVLIVVRPGLAGFDAYGLLVLVSVLFVALRDLATRALPAAVPTVLVTLTAAFAVTVMGGLQGLAEDWVRPTPFVIAQLAAAAAFIAVGYFTIIAAMRVGDMSATASFRYVIVVFAIALGFFVWGDVPDLATMAGSAIIIGSGLYTLHRERKRGREMAAAASAAGAVP